MTSEKVSSRKLNMYVPDSPMHFHTVARSCWVTILADDSLKYFYFLFLPEKGFLHFIWIDSFGDNLYEMPNTVSLEK